ncbi:MAG: FkbM family methyltransferase [Pseudomonadota bacterium]
MGITSMLKPGDIVLDCGANVGDVSEPLVATGATVHAFEPDPFAYDQLEKRLSGHPNITLHNAAVGVNAGQLRLMRGANFDDNPKAESVKSTLIAGGRHIDESDGITVDVVSLPELIASLAREHGDIAFLKMDIEGAELELLEHMHEHRLFDLVRLTVAETHPNLFKGLRGRFLAMHKAIAAAYPQTRVNLDWI